MAAVHVGANPPGHHYTLATVTDQHALPMCNQIGTFSYTHCLGNVFKQYLHIGHTNTQH